MLASPTISIASEDKMSAFGRRLATLLRPGDTVLLDGPIGAGKTHLARAIIQSLLDQPEEIPSPTYTLIQTYEGAGGEIWHADLYRLSDSSELVELGLDDAMERGIVLIEWPDRLPAEMTPRSALSIRIAPEGDSRKLSLSASSDRWKELLSEYADA